MAYGINHTSLEWREFLGGADIALVQLTDDMLVKFGLDDFYASRLSGGGIFRIPNIVFKGFQPDCTYVFSRGVSVEGLMGPYHSAIAVAAFMEGLKPHRALSLFNVFTYASLGYFAAYEASCELLHNDGVALGYELGDGLRKAGVFMHTINHPNIRILDLVATEALRISGLDYQNIDNMPRDALSESFIWPVYPEIANYLQVLPGGDFYGKKGFCALKDVVGATYEALAKHQLEMGDIILDQDRPAATPVIERARRFIQDHVI